MYIRRRWRILHSQQLNDVYTSPYFIWVSNQGRWNGLGTWNVRGRRQMHTEFGGGYLREEAGLTVKKIIICPRCNLLLKTRFWGRSCNGITVSLTMLEMLEYKQPVWRQKGSSPTTRLTCRETNNFSLGNYEYLHVSNTTVGKMHVIYWWRNVLNKHEV